MCHPPYELVGPKRATCQKYHGGGGGATWTAFPQCAKDVKPCTHVQCAQRKHSHFLKVRVTVSHGNCAHFTCDEQHGDRHYCRVDHDGRCHCKCWHTSDKGDFYHPLYANTDHDYKTLSSAATP